MICIYVCVSCFFFFFPAEDGIRDSDVTGVQTCALPIWRVPFFAYTGHNARGELVRGALENSDAGAVADQLLTSGVSPIDISATSGPKALSGEGWLRRLSTEKVTLEDLVLFSRQMYTLLKSGVPILKSLAALQESAARVGFASMLQDQRTSLDSDRDLSPAL